MNLLTGSLAQALNELRNSCTSTRCLLFVLGSILLHSLRMEMHQLSPMAPVSSYNHVFATEHSRQKVCTGAMQLSRKSEPESLGSVVHLQQLNHFGECRNPTRTCAARIIHLIGDMWRDAASSSWWEQAMQSFMAFLRVQWLVGRADWCPLAPSCACLPFWCKCIVTFFHLFFSVYDPCCTENK